MSAPDPSLSLLELVRADRFREDAPPPAEEPTLLLNGVAVCHPGNLSAIVSAPKRFKSACLGGAIASLLGAPEGSDLLGWSSPSGSGVVIHLDTEQSKRHHWVAMDRVRRRCGDSVDMNLLESYRVTGMEPAKILQLLREAVGYFGGRPEGIRAIIIDGVADLVQSPNDEAECFACVRELMRLATAANAPILTVVHLNPSDSKVRGHLGSEIERKSETVIELMDADQDSRRLKALGKMGNGRVITAVTRHARNAPLSLEDAPRFGWDEEADMPMSVFGEMASGQPDRDKALALEVLGAGEKLAPGELKQRIADKRGVGLEMAKKILSGWGKAQLVEKVGQHYQLHEKVTGNDGEKAGNPPCENRDGVTGNAPPLQGGSLPNYPLPHPDEEEPDDPAPDNVIEWPDDDLPF